MHNLKGLSIGNLKTKYPIIQGGMGIGISLSGLASAVANEGCIGVISAAGIGMNEPDYFSNYIESNIRALKKEIQKTRSLCKGIIGVNVMVAMTNYADLVRTSIAEGIDIVFSGAGLPLNLPEFLKPGCKTKLAPIVSSSRAAKLICTRWLEQYNYLPDLVVVEGPMAGGHLGFKTEQINDLDFKLEKLVPEVIQVVKEFEQKSRKKIPVIAAGGIFTGEDIYKYLKLGASGVQMGTRFVTTNECDASLKFKQAYLDSGEEDIEIIKSPVGMPGRALKSQFLDDVRNGKKKPLVCNYHCIRTCDLQTTPYCIVAALVNAKKGNFMNGFAFCGSNAYKTTEIVSVKSLVATLINEYETFMVGVDTQNNSSKE
jgi:nitronate monooxygenase